MLIAYALYHRVGEGVGVGGRRGPPNQSGQSIVANSASTTSTIISLATRPGRLSISSNSSSSDQ